MKVILIGYPDSQHIVPASRYLASKYLPGFDFHYLNYVGDTKNWATFVGSYMAHFQDELIIFALDDYLISGFDKEAYKEALKKFEDKQVVCVKLCQSTEVEHRAYPVTTQYTIWRRERLIDLFCATHDPWHFEMTGSTIFNQAGWLSVLPEKAAVKYDVHSCLSKRWEGINWNGVEEEDLEYIKANLLK